MKILALDTATEACSAALYIDDEITSRYQLAPREHSRLILRMIDDLLNDANIAIADIDAIAFGRGPGSFMGLRIAAGVIQGIAFAHDIPVVPVSTLKAIAQRAADETGCEHVLATIDARMDEVYWALYSKDQQSWVLDGEEQVIAPENVQVPEWLLAQTSNCVGAGTGWRSYADRLLPGIELHQVLPECYPNAEAIARLAADAFAAGNSVSAAQAIPVYLRNDVAKKPGSVVF